MSNSIQIQLAPAAVALLRTSGTWPVRVLEALRKSTDLQNELTVGHIQAARLSGKGPFPVDEGRLGVVTNRLRSSLRPAKAVVNGTQIESSLGSNVRYAGAHEFGFDGAVTVRAHTRTNPRADLVSFRGQQGRRDAFGGALLTPAGKTRKGVVPVASAVVSVRQHTAQRHVPARAPIRHGIEDRAADYGQAYSAAIIAALRPTP